MADFYSDSNTVRLISGIKEDELDDSFLFIAQQEADNYIANLLGDPLYATEFFDLDLNMDKILYLKENTEISEINDIYINGIEVPQYKRYNLITNGDFLEENSDDDIPYFWSAENAGSDILQLTTDEAFIGGSCIKITKSASGKSYFYSDNINIDYSKKYKLFVHIKTENISGGNGVYAEIKWYDYNGIVIKTDTSDIITADQDWTETTIAVGAPYNADYVSINLVNECDSGTAYFDNAIFKEQNWDYKTNPACVIFSNTQKNKSIKIRYSLTSSNNEIKSLANYIAARNLLLSSLGGTINGLKYSIGDFSIDKTQQTKIRLTLLNKIDGIINNILDVIGKRESSEEGVLVEWC